MELKEQAHILNERQRIGVTSHIDLIAQNSLKRICNGVIGLP